MRLYELSRDHARAPASTFNPKVAGSIPARPIRRERIRDAQRPTTQSAREIAKADITQKSQGHSLSPTAKERRTDASYAELVPLRMPLGQHEVNN
jgi:hypothetical protein